MLLLVPLILSVATTFARFPSARIIGGQPMLIEDRPFQVLIFNTVPILEPGCGGSIIGHRWVLTAAHCIADSSPSDFYIRAGADELENDDKALWYKPESLFVHEGFIPHSETNILNDIGLVRVKHKFRYSDNIRPISLRRSSPIPLSQVLVSGFGSTSEGGTEMSSDLRAVSLGVVDRKTCIRLLHKFDASLSVSQTHFCAADLTGGRDACQGDSGGPATIGSELAGITSWGVGCAEKMLPAFYTDVSLFVPWINSIIRQHSKKASKHKKHFTRLRHNVPRYYRRRGCSGMKKKTREWEDF